MNDIQKWLRSADLLANETKKAAQAVTAQVAKSSREVQRLLPRQTKGGEK